MKKQYLFIYGPLNAGGAERVLLDFLKNFDYKKNDVTLLQVVGGGSLSDEIPEEVNVVKAWSGYDFSYKIAIRLALRFGKKSMWRNRMIKTLKGKKFDLAISFLEGMPIKAHSLILDVAKRNYSWVHCDIYNDSNEVEMFCDEADELKCYNNMTSVICVSSYARQSFIKRFPACGTNVNVINNPIDINKISMLAIEKIITNNVFTICLCGRIVKQKRFDRAIRLAKKLKDQSHDIKIQIIGDGELREELYSMSKSYDVDNIIEFVGYQRNPYPFIKAADILLCVSDVEGFGLVICEAMLLGTAVVSTKAAGPSEIIQDGINGLLCDFKDESIYSSVEELITNDEKRILLANNAKKRVLDFSIINIMEKIYKL